MVVPDGKLLFSCAYKVQLAVPQVSWHSGQPPVFGCGPAEPRRTRLGVEEYRQAAPLQLPSVIDGGENSPADAAKEGTGSHPPNSGVVSGQVPAAGPRPQASTAEEQADKVL